jgi:K+-transporting ATPase ATPase A chain
VAERLLSRVVLPAGVGGEADGGVEREVRSAATGIALAIAFIRGLARRRARTLGNFYVDVIRATLYVLLPICVLGTVVLLSRGAVQTLSGPATAHTLSGVEQVIARGPVASQEVIKDLSGDGGGFFNANSAHPFENPDGFTNQLEILLQLLIPSALAVTFGRMVGNLRQGLAVAAAMAVIVAGAMTLSTWAEQHGNHALDTLAVHQAAGPGLSGGNMEGKEVRLGAIGSAEFAVAGTASGDGAVNSSMDSFVPSAAWRRCCSCRSARSPLEAPGPGSTGCSSSPSWRSSSPVSWSGEHPSTSARRSRAGRSSWWH